MGIYNRDYMRNDGGRGVQITGPKYWSALTWLVVINVVVFIIQHFFIQGEMGKNDFPWGGITRDTILKGRVYELVTHFFIHANGLHLLFNMIMLIVFGRFLQPSIGQKRFLKLYLIAGLVSGLGSLGLQWSMNPNMIGASGAVMAIAIATCFGFGEMQVRLLFPPISVKLKWLGWALIAIDVFRLIFMVVNGGKTAPGEANVGAVAHLIGAACGIIFVKVSISRGPESSIPRSSRKPRREKPAKPEKKKKPLSKDVDEILDKISEKGFQSLTDEEKKILDNKSRELSDE